jgi:hypothetical protein
MSKVWDYFGHSLLYLKNIFLFHLIDKAQPSGSRCG